VSIVNGPRRWAAAAVLTVLAAGCGSSPAPVTRSPTTTPPPAITTAPATATPSAPAPSGHQKVTVTRATGLKSGQKALVQATGFSPGESLVVSECAAKGAATGPGDCDLNGMQSVTADASGQVKVDLTVTKGPFGANNIVCGPARPCLISVTQATPSPTQEADTPITFGLPGHARLRQVLRQLGTGVPCAITTPPTEPSSAPRSPACWGRYRRIRLTVSAAYRREPAGRSDRRSGGRRHSRGRYRRR
jgi:Neocarzinostatin family